MEHQFKIENCFDYRYGYQGSEKDDEITGVTGSHITTYFREYDTRLARTWSLDPIFQPWQSSYISMDNNPIWFNDPMGDKVKYLKSANASKRETKRAVKNSFSKEEYKTLKKEKDVYQFYAETPLAKKENGLLTSNPRSYFEGEYGNFIENAQNNLGSKERNDDGIQEYTVRFRIPKTESFFMGGVSGLTNKPQERTSKKTFISGTVIITGGANYDTGDDQVEILFKGHTIKPTITLNEGLENTTESRGFKLDKRGRIQIKVSNKNTVKNGPGAFGINVVIKSD